MGGLEDENSSFHEGGEASFVAVSFSKGASLFPPRRGGRILRRGGGGAFLSFSIFSSEKKCSREGGKGGVSLFVEKGSLGEEREGERGGSLFSLWGGGGKCYFFRKKEKHERRGLFPVGGKKKRGSSSCRWGGGFTSYIEEGGDSPLLMKSPFFPPKKKEGKVGKHGKGVF